MTRYFHWMTRIGGEKEKKPEEETASGVCEGLEDGCEAVIGHWTGIRLWSYTQKPAETFGPCQTRTSVVGMDLFFGD